MSCLNQSVRMQKWYHYSPRCMSQPWAYQCSWTSHLMILAHWQHSRRRTSLRLLCLGRSPCYRWPLGCTAFAAGLLCSACSGRRWDGHYQHGIMFPMVSLWRPLAHFATWLPSNPIDSQICPNWLQWLTENWSHSAPLHQPLPLDLRLKNSLPVWSSFDSFKCGLVIQIY